MKQTKPLTSFTKLIETRQSLSDMT